MANNILGINRFYGGISDTETFGTAGAFSTGYNIDIHRKADVLYPSKRTVKESSTTITDPIKWMHQVADGTLYALANNGKIYKRTTAGVWSLDHTDANGGNGQGACVFENNYYYASQSKLGKLTLPSTYNDNFQTFGIGDTDWHPMTVWGAGTLYIGDGNTLSELQTASVYNNNILVLPTGYKIRCLEPVSDDLLAIGTWKGTDITKNEEARIFFWDGISSRYVMDIVIGDGGVLAMKFSHPNLYVFCGTSGVIRVYNMAEVLKIKEVPNVLTSESLDIYPGAVDFIKNDLYFGTSAGTNSAVRGVYKWGNQDKNFPQALTIPHTISTGTITSNATVTSVKRVNSSQLLIAWKDNTTYGVDITSGTLDSQLWSYETLIDTNYPFTRKRLHTVTITHKPIITGQSLKLYKKLNYETNYTEVTQKDTFDEARGVTRFTVDTADAFNYQIKITGNSSVNTNVPITGIYAEYEY